jgi:hypothetical protein
MSREEIRPQLRRSSTFPPELIYVQLQSPSRFFYRNLLAITALQYLEVISTLGWLEECKADRR